SLADVLTDLQDRQAALLDHHHYSLADIQKDTGLPTLFDTIVVFESYPWDGAGAEMAEFGLTMSRLRYSTGTHYPLTLMAVPEPLRMTLQYQREVLEQQAVQQMADRYLRVLEQIIENPDVPVGSVEVLSAEERAFLEQRQARPVASEGRRPATRATNDKALLPGMFEAAVAAMPGAVAVTDGARSLTYAELDARANGLAFELIERGVGPDRPVAVATRRPLDSVVALLAVAKAGGVHLPIDARRPVLDAVGSLNGTGPQVVLTDRETAEMLPEPGIPCLYVDGTWTPIDQAPTDADRLRPLRPQHLAYASGPGSDGSPYGAAVTHRNVTGLVTQLAARLGTGPGARLVSCMQAGSDTRITETLVALSTGGTLDLAGDPASPSPSGTGSRTIISTAPSALAGLLESTDGHIGAAAVVFSGEELPADLVTRAREAIPGASVLSWYGQPETGSATTLTVDPSDDWAAAGTAPLGMPLQDVQVLVLGPGLAPVPPRVTGELYIAGPGLARGYLGAPGLTASRFVANPFDPSGGRMYRTGDLVRRTRTGELMYVGRTDDRVRLRGMRIALGDVQSAVTAHPGVAQAAVVIRDRADGTRLLVAYVVPETAGDPVDDLRDFVADRVPAPMVPVAFVTVDQLPLTADGQVDQAALPTPVTESRSR
ncbi:AMP-binding protein, partial [Actinomadura opuntiae]|uniref:AMP-binding protein n=1 Tax=Actinomadura sp. OS1-43 TaxID=604315 RepID=UPI00255AECAF